MLGGAPAQSRQLREQGRKTLRRLLDAAIVVFDARGYHATRVDDIVKVARTSHGTFYLYFASKEDLFQALIADVTEEMRELAEALPPISPSKAGYDELRSWLGRFYDLYQHYHPVIRAWTEANAQNPDMARTGALVLRRFIDQLVRRVREGHRAAIADPQAAALAMVSMVERAIPTPSSAWCRSSGMPCSTAWRPSSTSACSAACDGAVLRPPDPRTGSAPSARGVLGPPGCLEASRQRRHVGGGEPAKACLVGWAPPDRVVGDPRLGAQGRLVDLAGAGYR